MTRTQKTSGFGLVEILVALLLIAVVGVSIAMFGARGARESGDTRMRAEAVALAEQKLTELQAMTGGAEFNQIASNEDIASAANHIQGTTAEFVRTWHVDTDTNVAKRVTITVAWRSSIGDEHTVANGMVYQESNAIRRPGAFAGASPCPGHEGGKGGAMPSKNDASCGNASPMGLGH